MEKAQRVKLATVAILALVLSAGFLLGALWDRRLDAQPAPDSNPSSDTVASDGARQRGGERRVPIYSRVTPPLSPEQMTQAEGILGRRRDAARALMKESRIDSLYVNMKAAEKAFRAVYDPRFEALADSTRAAIKQLMTPEQAAQYDSLLARDRRRNGDGTQGNR